MKHKHIIRSLPLLASILGRKYGVQVRIGGDTACTDGTIIYLPGLPLECDDTLLGLIRGYLDHEAAHIRDTDFNALKTANVTPLEKHIWNIIEDWRVENMLAAIFPGCRENFQWLIKHLFLTKSAVSKQPPHPGPAMLILQWLLIAVRAWDVPELNDERDFLRASAEIHYPGLTHELEPVLRLVPNNCASTLEAFGFACDIVSIIRKYAQFMEQQQTAHADGQSDPGAQPDAGSDQQDHALQSLQGLLAAQDTDLPSGIGEQVKRAITEACSQSGCKTQVAVYAEKPLSELPPQEQDACRQATTALRARLQAMMQSLRAVRNHSGYVGSLDTRKLHRLATGDTRIFLRRGERVSVNTAVHILLDSSSSMHGSPIALAS